MQLTKQTDFAFRTLIYLSSLREGELTSIAHVCEYYDISANHLSKVVQRLAHAGFVETVRGKGGGIRLATAPEDIALVDVVLQMEPTLQAVNCDEPTCRIISGCRLRGLLHTAMQSFLETLQGKSLADIGVPRLARDVVTVQLSHSR